MNECPARVLVNAQIEDKLLVQLSRHPCADCKRPLCEHPLDLRENVDPRMAFVVNPERLARL